MKNFNHDPQKTGAGGHKGHKGFKNKTLVYFVSFVFNRFL